MPRKTRLPKNVLAALRVRNFWQLLWARLTARRSYGARPIADQILIMQFKNEQDILEPFLRHHSPLFDAILVLNNGSADASADILAKLVQELPNVIPIDAPTTKNELSRSISHVFRQAQSAFFADFVFFLDADEFIGTAARADFDRAIAAVPVGQGGRIAWRSYVPDPALDEGAIPDPLLRMTYRRRFETARWTTTKMFLRLGGTFDAAQASEQGNHKQRTGLNRKFRARLLPDLPLLHFPLRSGAQSYAKGIVGWAGYAARQDPSLGGGQHWEKLHRQFQEQTAPITAQDLTEMAMRYGTREELGDFASNGMRDDHGVTTLRRFSDGRYGDATALIAAALAPQPMPSQTLNLPPDANIDVPPVQYLMTRYAPASVLEISTAAFGYDHVCHFFGAGQVVALTWDMLPHLDRESRFDMVLALDMPQSDPVFDQIARQATNVIVACHPLGIEGPLQAWAARGWYPDLIATLGARALATLIPLHRHLLVLRPVQQDGAADKLRQIAGYPHHDYPQIPRPRLSLFTDPFPDLTQGYGLRLR